MEVPIPELWNTYSIKRIFGQHDDFIQAKNMLKSAEFTSEFESDNSIAKHKRKFHAAKFNKSSCDEIYDSGISSLPPFPKPPAQTDKLKKRVIDYQPSTSKSLRTSPDLFESNDKDIESLFDNIDSVEDIGIVDEMNRQNNEVRRILLDHDKPATLEPLDNSAVNQDLENNDIFTFENSNETSNLNSHIAHLEAAHKNHGPLDNPQSQIWLIQAVVQMKTDLKIMKSVLNSNNLLIKQILFDSNSEHEDFDEEISNLFPLTSEANLLELEEKLKTNKHLHKYLKNKISKLVSNDYKQSVFIILRFLLSNELGSKLTCCGKTGKLGFSSLALYDILEKAVLKRHQNISRQELQQPLQSWFRHSKERYTKDLNKKSVN